MYPCFTVIIEKGFQTIRMRLAIQYPNIFAIISIIKYHNIKRLRCVWQPYRKHIRMTMGKCIRVSFRYWEIFKLIANIFLVLNIAILVECQTCHYRIFVYPDIVWNIMIFEWLAIAAREYTYLLIFYIY